MLALYFAIICRWQLSSSEKLLVGKENSSIYFRDLTDLDIFYTDIVFHFLWQMPVYLVGYAKCMLYSEQSTVLLTHFENLDFISNIFQETRFLSLDGPTNYLYLFKKHQQTFSWPGERPSSHLKVTKMWFGPNIKYRSEPFFAGFCCREGISCLLYY